MITYNSWHEAAEHKQEIICLVLNRLGIQDNHLLQKALIYLLLCELRKKHIETGLETVSIEAIASKDLLSDPDFLHAVDFLLKHGLVYRNKDQYALHDPESLDRILERLSD